MEGSLILTEREVPQPGAVAGNLRAHAEVLDLCENARRASGGWFDPWAMPAGVDPTGLVKGWAVEQALAVLHEAGMEAAMVNGGGDIAVFGAPARGLTATPDT